jgi:alginate O-acetyltransferase complex protein AlgI
MVFSSIEFLLFFIVFYVLFLCFKNRGNIYLIFLLISSYFFYMCWIPIYIWVLLATTIFDYGFGLLISGTEDEKKRRLFIISSVVINLGLLCYFKYMNFFISNINDVRNILHIGGHNISMLNITLPIGISFFTFKSMSYTIDVYNEKIVAEKNFLKFATFVAFFPELVAGPIVRAEKLLPQLSGKVNPTLSKFFDGTKLFIIGFFKKLFIADMISPYSDNVFAHYNILSGYEVLVGVIAYTIQVYCDFSGYTDMAIGVAKMMDYNFPENFNMPYLSKNVLEFWHRWHMSLFSWFTDYVYNPIVFRLRSWRKYGIIVAVFVTFFLSGLWHGASWHYVCWGLLQFVAIAYETFTLDIRKKFFSFFPKAIADGIGVFFTVCYFGFTAIFFRAPNFTVAFGVIRKLCTIKIAEFYYIPQFTFLLILMVLGHVLYYHFFTQQKQWKRNKFVEAILYFWLIWMLIVMAPTHTSPFVYFQF